MTWLCYSVIRTAGLKSDSTKWAFTRPFRDYLDICYSPEELCLSVNRSCQCQLLNRSSTWLTCPADRCQWRLWPLNISLHLSKLIYTTVRFVVRKLVTAADVKIQEIIDSWYDLLQPSRWHLNKTVQFSPQKSPWYLHQPMVDTRAATSVSQQCYRWTFRGRGGEKKINTRSRFTAAANVAYTEHKFDTDWSRQRWTFV